MPSMGSHRVGHDWSNLAVGGVECREHAQYPAFAFCFRHLKSGSWVFWSLCIFLVQNLPKLRLQAVIFRVIWGELCPGTSTGALQQKVPDPRTVSELTRASSASLSSGNQSTSHPRDPASQCLCQCWTWSSFLIFARYKMLYHCCFNLHFSHY